MPPFTRQLLASIIVRGAGSDAVTSDKTALDHINGWIDTGCCFVYRERSNSNRGK